MASECVGANFEDEVTSCHAYRKKKLLEHAMKIVEKVPEKEFMNVDAMQFGFIPRRTPTDAIVVLKKRKRYVEMRKESSIYMCFVDVKKKM